MTEKPKHIHIIGICGVLNSALAIALHKKGWKVTGSDKGFFPPVSTYLSEAGVPYYAGWHPEKMVANGAPDIIVTATASGTQNPETLYAREHGLTIKSPVDIFEEYFIAERSIVCVGTWGKTSSSALLSFILDKAGLNPSYMFGGVSLSHEQSAHISEGGWSVFEGDEYKSSPTDSSAKFFHYKPTHLLITAVSWDHADLYPTEESYFDAFKKLVSLIPSQGKIVACTDDEGVNKILDEAKEAQVITYGKQSDAMYTYGHVTETRSGISFTISHGESEYKINSPMLGGFQAENITGCFAMACEAGISPEKIIEAVADFKGLKRRLEKRYENDITVVDDIAHSPEKASSVLKTLRTIYSGSIFTIFEPNIGGRKMEAKEKYHNAFKDADQVIIPRLTKLKVTDDEKDQPIEGNVLRDIVAESHANTFYIDNDEALIQHLLNHAKKGDVIAFLGSHGFRGMIEQLVTSLHPQSPLPPSRL